jgi:N utilization substance protein B
MAQPATPKPPRRGRSAARELALQALYQWQVTGQSGKDLVQEFEAQRMGPAVDEAFFRDLVIEATARREELLSGIAEFADRPVEQLDPVERGVLLIGLYELVHRPEVPWRVVISEAVDLCRRYGAADGYRYVNALLDRAARRYRAVETGA